VRKNREQLAVEVWKMNRQVPAIPTGARLRIQAGLPFLLHWTTDEWLHSTDTRSTTTAVGIDFVDLPVSEQATTIRFTFLWVDENRWEGRDYNIDIHPGAQSHDDVKEKPYAIRNGRSGQDGREHGAASDDERPRMRGVQ
jgi:hypothetical protein